MKRNTKHKGFTLIELLVVISIISLLSSVILAAMKSARDRARDSAILQTAKEFQKSIEVYRLDKGYYPHESPTVTQGNASYYYNKTTNSDGTLTTYIAPANFNLPTLIVDYYNKMPTPLNFNGAVFRYLSSGNSTFYKCSNDNVLPKYIIVFSTLNDLDLPTYQVSSTGSPSWSDVGYNCLSF